MPFPSAGDLPDPGIEARSLALQADALLTELQGKPRRKSGKGDKSRESILLVGKQTE